MKSSEAKKYAPAIGFIMLFALLLYSAILLSPTNTQVPEKQPECPENKTRACSTGPCNGTESCSNGTWSSCTWQVICEPGAKAACQPGGCACGYKECDICGSGYSVCIGSCGSG